MTLPQLFMANFLGDFLAYFLAECQFYMITKYAYFVSYLKKIGEKQHLLPMIAWGVDCAIA